MEKDIIADAKDAFAECEDAESENRNWALEDLRFARLGEQWPDKVKKQREDEGRPCLTINRLPSFIRQVVNDARQNKPSIKVHPVDSGADVETAKVIDGIIRNIEYTSNADTAYDTAIDFAASCGFGALRVAIDYTRDDSFDTDLIIKRVSNPFTIYRDPRSEEADSSDWNVSFVTEMMDKDEFIKKYPDSEVSDWAGDKDDDWLSDDRVRIAEYWTRSEVEKQIFLLSDGMIVDEQMYLANKELFEVSGIKIVNQRITKSYKVMQHMVGGDQVLGEPVEWLGRYIPIIPVYGEEINVEGKRYFLSLIRQAKDAQQMYNFWRTATTELVALAPKAPWVGPTGFAKTDSRWDTANTQSHQYLEYDGNTPPIRTPFAGVPAGALQEALNASDDMKSIMGLFDASLGAKSNETSGKAIMARQREGDISTFHFIDNMTRSIRHTGRILLDLIPYNYNKERVMRIMGEDGAPSTVTVNQQVQQENGEVINVYSLTSGKYDLTVKSGPSFTTRREEASAQMMELLRVFPQAAPVVGDLLAKNLDWPGADEIAERLQKMQQAQSAPPDPMKDPKVIASMQEIKLKRDTAQNDMQIKREQADLDMKIKAEEHAQEMQQIQAKQNAEAEHHKRKVVEEMVVKGRATPEGEHIPDPIVTVMAQTAESIQQNNQLMASLAQNMATAVNALVASNAAETQIIRDKAGRAIGARRVVMQ